MSHQLSPLFQADDSLFLDLASLNLVRFEGNGRNEKAHLTFKNGGSETVQGESARNLRQSLTVLGTSYNSTPSTTEHTNETDAIPQSSPSRPLHIDFTTTPLQGRKKAWFYGRDKDGRGLILAFVNAKGSCSVRPFDGETGIALGKRRESGSYQERFSDMIEGASELTVDSQPNLEEDCKQRLPERLLAYLRKQIERVA
jgi:hypothetical protein